MTTTLVLPTRLADDIEQAARHPLETAGVLLASLVKAPNGDLRLLGQEVRWVGRAEYLERGRDHLTIGSLGYVPALSDAEQRNLVAIWLHTHPSDAGIPLPSRHDRIVDSDLADVFRLRTGGDYYGSLIFSARTEGLAFSGALHPEKGDRKNIDRLWIVGDDWRLIRAFDSVLPPIAPIFDRSVRAFGPAIQSTLSDLRVAVIGAGGTGSAVSEQLVRLGVRHLLIMDSDVLSETNVTRVYGSSPGKVGRCKVDVLKGHLCAIAPDLTCEPVKAMVTSETAALRLLSYDLVFGCTDDNAGRLVLSRIATYLLTPVIDVGVLLSSDNNGSLTGIDGRITTLAPGTACLVCRDRVDTRRAAAELMTPGERKKLEEEGYAPALAGVEPAVVAFTTGVAAAAVNELLERLIGFGPKPRPNEVLLRWHEREISTNIRTPRPGHYCAQESGKWGFGCGSPFLEQVWSVT